MRRVYDDHQLLTGLIKNEDGAIKLRASAYWPADYKEAMSIKTSNSFTLRCSNTDWGSGLMIGIGWYDTDLDVLSRWSRNFDGFEVDEDFSRTWEFQPAVRHLPLQSAKTTEETE